MTELILAVDPLVQDKSMDCWLKAAEILYAYRGKQLPTSNWLNRKYTNNRGMGKLNRRRMARELGLGLIPNEKHTEIDRYTINNWLFMYGPIWCVMAHWGRGRKGKVPRRDISGNFPAGQKLVKTGKIIDHKQAGNDYEGREYGHVIVLTGIETLADDITRIHFHDPEDSIERTVMSVDREPNPMKFTRFNELRARTPYSFLYLAE